MKLKCWELFKNYLVWEMLYNCGCLFFTLKFALLWPMASRRIAFWQFCLFIILSNAPNYPIKALSLPLTCFFPLYFPSRLFFPEFKYLNYCFKTTVEHFWVCWDHFRWFFSDRLLWLKGSTDPKQWHLNEVSEHVESGRGFQCVVFSLYSFL